MSLVENWRKIAQLNLSATSPLDNNNARGFGIALASAAADLESACTPRPPKAEWFGAPFDGEGKPTGKWDAWWVDSSQIDAIGTWLGCDVYVASYGRLYLHQGGAVIAPLDVITGCVPVAREGFPAPVGWAVVGG